MIAYSEENQYQRKQTGIAILETDTYFMGLLQRLNQAMYVQKYSAKSSMHLINSKMINIVFLLPGFNKRNENKG